MREDAHERKMCDAVMRFYAARTHSDIQMHSRPEAVQRNSPSVEYLYSSQFGFIAVEHTRIESFPQQIRDSKTLLKILAPLEEELRGKLPTPGKYTLAIESDVAHRVRGDYSAIRRAIGIWATRNAAKLAIGTPRSAPKHMLREQPAGVPFTCTLYRWQSSKRYEGRIRIARYLPAGIETQRRQRIAMALTNKLPKLAAAKQQNGHNTSSVLILESNDIALANTTDIGAAFLETIPTHALVPDFVYLVETEDSPWYLTILKEGINLFPRIDDGKLIPLW